MKALLHARAGAVCAVLSLAALAPAAHAQTGQRESSNASPEAVVRALRDDDALLQRVATALADDPELADVEITVFVDEGKVALEGETLTAGQAVRAVAVTRRAAGEGVEVLSGLRSADPRDAAGA